MSYSTNNKKIIYLDNAATTKMDPEALNKYVEISKNCYGNASQPYFLGVNSKKILNESRKIIAKCINANPDQIFFTSGGTESDNWVIKKANISKKREDIVVSLIEHHAILNSCKEYNVNYISVDSTGTIDLNELKKSVTNKTRIVSIMYANNEIGTIQPIKEAAQIAHKKGALFHTDAVQAVGHVNIDVKDLDVDYLSASAHKFNGPKGIGFLYVKDVKTIDRFEDGGEQENRKRGGTENVAAIYAMATALKNNIDNLVLNQRKIMNIENYFYKKISSFNLDYVINKSPNKLPGIISVSFKNADGEMMMHRLDLANICVSTGAACDTKKTEASHVIKAIKVKPQYALGTIRISIGKNNCKKEIDLLTKEILKILK